LRALAALEPGEAKVRVEIARELLRAEPQRIGEPLAWLDEAIRLAPDDPFLLGLKAELFFRVGDWKVGGVWARRALALEPGFAVARLMLAESMARGGDIASAKEQLRLARQLLEQGRASPSADGVSRWDEERYRRLRKLVEHAR